MVGHLCFVCAKTKNELDKMMKPGFQYNWDNENEFKSWLGQFTINMYLLYKLAQDTNENNVNQELLDLAAHPKFFELNTWIRNQVREFDKNYPDKMLIINLGTEYKSVIDLMEAAKISYGKKVVYLLNDRISSSSRECVVE